MNDNIWPKVAAHGWKYRKRTQKIRVALIHATRGGQRHPTEVEYQATINWEISPANIVIPDVGGEVYGSMASRIVGAGGRHCMVMPDDYYPAYSAGHIDPIAISFETCQSNADMPYDERDFQRLAQEVAIVCKRNGIPPRNIPYLSGDNREAPGIAYHDRCANGTKWGKTDPGDMFDRERFARRVAELMEVDQEDEMWERHNEEARTPYWKPNGHTFAAGERAVLQLGTDLPGVMTLNPKAIDLDWFNRSGGGRFDVLDGDGKFAGRLTPDQKGGTIRAVPVDGTVIVQATGGPVTVSLGVVGYVK